jgi:hypothetical protein
MKIKALLKIGTISGLIAALVNAVIYYASTLSGIITNSFLLPDGNPLGIVPVVVSSFLPGIIGSLFLFGLSKFTKNPVLIFSIIGYAFLLFSLIGPLTLPNLPTGMRVSMTLMHLVAGIIIITQLRKVTQ